MTEAYPRKEMFQRRIPGTDGAEVTLVLHAITSDNYSQRVTIRRRAVGSKKPRFHDIVLTRADLDELIDELIYRRDEMSGDVPRSRNASSDRPGHGDQRPERRRTRTVGGVVVGPDDGHP